MNNTHHPRTAVLAVVNFLAGCTTPADAAGRAAAGDVTLEIARLETAILETDRAWTAAVAAGDRPRILSFWTEDAVLLPPGTIVVRGRDAIRAVIDHNRARPGFTVRRQPESAGVFGSGDLGYSTGSFEMSEADGSCKPVTRPGHYLAIWHRLPDGEWKCVVSSVRAK